MNPGDCAPRRHRCLRVLPRPRGSWIVATERAVLSEHGTAPRRSARPWRGCATATSRSSSTAITAAIGALGQSPPARRLAHRSAARAEPRVNTTASLPKLVAAARRPLPLPCLVSGGRLFTMTL
jgi:hypothetical protein